MRHSESLLLDHLRRIARAPRMADWSALVLHFARLPPPGARPHHRRVALVLLHDHASAADGQAYALANGDLVLLGRPAGGDWGALPSLLHRLLQAAGGTADLLSCWNLAAEPARMAACLAQLPPISAAPGPASHTGRLHTPLHRQTAVLRTADGMRPLFHEIALVAPQPADPRHIAALDRTLLAALSDTPHAAPLPLHLNLTLESILTPEFARFAAQNRGSPPGIELQFTEICDDPETFTHARTRLDTAGMALVLDGLSHHSLLLANPARLAPALLKLDWSPAMPDAMDVAIAGIGPERVLLHRADSEAALLWGAARGINRFQGRHVDALLAAAA